VTENKNGSGRASKDINVYLEFMEPRIREIYRVLKPTGSFYLHCDWHADSYLRVLCDKIFNRDPNSVIIWKRQTAKSMASKKFDVISDSILFYTKSENYLFNPQRVIIDLDKMKKDFSNTEENTNRKFKHQGLEIPNKNKDEVRIIQGKEVKTTLGWKWTQETFDQRLKENPNLIYWTKNNKPRYKLYMDEFEGIKVTNIWDDISNLTSKSAERLGYPTQKPEALLERIIQASSNEGDIVLDAFCGCGTTLAVAKKLKRQFIGIDVSPTACRLVANRIKERLDSILGLPLTPEEIGNLDGFEFQNWVIREFGGFSGKRGADGGIDGKLGDCPIQVKKYKAGRNDLDQFSGAMLRENTKEGIYIALDFSADFKKEVARLKRANDILIYYFTVKDILDKLHYPILDEKLPKHGLDKYSKKD
jgi:DNA modification methylase